MFTTKLCEKLLPFDNLEKLHLVGELDMTSNDFVKTLNDIRTGELLVVARNFAYKQAIDLFYSATCSIVIAAEGTILGKNCKNGGLINTAMRYSTFPHFTQIHFINCDFTVIEEIATHLGRFYENRSEHCEHYKTNDSGCTDLVQIQNMYINAKASRFLQLPENDSSFLSEVNDIYVNSNNTL